MRKVKVYQRKNRNGYYVQWRENGLRKTKQCNTKTEANHFAHLKYMQINNDVYTSVNMCWDELKKEFLQRYDIMGLAKSTKEIASRFLEGFEKICRPAASASINQKMCNYYILARQKKQLNAYTINKDIGRLKTFINWLVENKYNSGGIRFSKLKTSPVFFKVLTTEQIRALFKACPTPAWRGRILLSLVTGLRKNDIDNLTIDTIDMKRLTLDSRSQKTRKAYIGRPLPKDATRELKRYLNGLPDGQIKLFTDKNTHKEWTYLRNRAKGCSSVTRQDLRKTFSTLIQKVGSIGSAQNLLEHSASRTTEEFYTDTELILRWKVNQLPVKKWLK